MLAGYQLPGVGDGFGIGALPPVLVSEELARGELTLLAINQRPPNLQVVSWRVGAEWVEEIVTLCQHVVEHYAQEVGEHYMVLSTPGQTLKRGFQNHK
ncbi:hypothetical protein ABIA48_001520 [Pseudomonas sp. S30_BP2TU TE3576]